MTLRQALAHRPTILALGYFHCPNLCGLVRDDLMKALSSLDAPPDYSLVVLSIDPSETPADARVRPAGRRCPLRTGRCDWHYLTGVRRPSGRSPTRSASGRGSMPASKQFLHPAGLVFLTGPALSPATCWASAISPAMSGWASPEPPTASPRARCRSCCCVFITTPRPAATPWRSCGCCSLAPRSPSWSSPEPSCWPCAVNGGRNETDPAARRQHGSRDRLSPAWPRWRLDRRLALVFGLMRLLHHPLPPQQSDRPRRARRKIVPFRDLLDHRDAASCSSACSSGASVIYVRQFQPPANALKIYVVAKQWMWKIEHAGGQREINALHVPIDTPVELVMTSEDVIHDFFVPAFRVKRDVLPGQYETMWFRRAGSAPIICSARSSAAPPIPT